MQSVRSCAACLQSKSHEPGAEVCIDCETAQNRCPECGTYFRWDNIWCGNGGTTSKCHACKAELFIATGELL